MKDGSNKFDFTLFKKEVIDSQFKRLRQELTPKMNHKKLMERFHKILHNRVIPAVTYDQDSPAFFVYRVTTVYEGFDQNNPKSYSYNPNPKEYGRAHLVGLPVFYGAIDPTTAISEMKGELDNGEKFYLSKWKIKFKSKTSVHSLVVNSKTIKFDHVLASIATPIHTKLKSMFNNIPKDYLSGHMHAIEKMGDLFTTSSDSLYHITSAYSYEIIYDSKSKGLYMPILLYPSVANNFSGVNWAIHPDFVDSNNMELKDVIELSVEENNLKNDKASVEVSIHQRLKLFDDKIRYWEAPHFRIKKIDYEQIKIEIDNGAILNYNNTHCMQLNNTNSTVKDLIDYSMKNNKIEENLHKIKVNQEESIFDFTEKEYKHAIPIVFKNGNEIITNNGIFGIRKIHIPIVWIKGFKKINP